MNALYRKVKTFLELLDQKKQIPITTIGTIGILPCDYREDDSLPSPADFVPFDTENETWGNGYDKHAWFSFSVEVPAVPEGDDVYLQITTTPDGGGINRPPQMLVYVNGAVAHGFDIYHTRLYLSEGKYDILIYAHTGILPVKATIGLGLYRRNILAEKLWYDIKVPFDALELLDPEGYEYRNILRRLDDAIRLLDLYEVPSEAFNRSLKIASDYMDKEFYGKFCSVPQGDAPAVVGIGHTHIDCAWLWSLRQSREKVQRTFTSMLDLMERYPEFRFMSSQPLLYKWFKETLPEQYEKIREMVRAGKWECEGAMWVEADCNIPSGESLVRQIIHGKRFFREEFGVENRVLWLPDVFGYSAALPQILKKSGVDWFVTSKISWNDTNRMPYDTFLWRGIDGTGINTYFLTAQDKTREETVNRTTYCAKVTPAQVAGAYARYTQKELNNETLITFGYGDGGGGSTEEHLEVGRRLAKGIPGIPAFRVDYAGNFLSRLEKKIENNPRLPVWSGELYLEFHRGTYTTQARNKKNNRRSESLCLNTELYSVLAARALGREYPKETLRHTWEMILTNQFHDIIPGSSVREVYEQCERDYATIRSLAEPALADAQTALAEAIDRKNGYVAFNPNPTVGRGFAKLNGKSVWVENIPPKGYACVNAPKAVNCVRVTDREMENNFFRVLFDEKMHIISLFDKRAKREVIRAGGFGNELRVYADYPDKYDAWEWSEWTPDVYRTVDDVTAVECVDDGARAGICITRKFGKSIFRETIWLGDELDRLDFDFAADWQEDHVGLKVAFDVAVNSPRATYEIQYGTVERPTHKNTSWDRAKFEVCGHRFADLSEGGYGVALLNDCKYGYDIHDGLMTLTLLRSPTHPDPLADRGEQTCSYSILPHIGAMDAAELYTNAYAINNPPVLLPATGKENAIPVAFSAVTSDCSNILCEVVKQAEDGTDTVFRFFECSNTATVARLTFGFPVGSVMLCDLLERGIRPLKIRDNTVELPFGAFEIHTLKVTPAK